MIATIRGEMIEKSPLIQTMTDKNSINLGIFLNSMYANFSSLIRLFFLILSISISISILSKFRDFNWVLIRIIKTAHSKNVKALKKAKD